MVQFEDLEPATRKLDNYWRFKAFHMTTEPLKYPHYSIFCVSVEQAAVLYC